MAEAKYTQLDNTLSDAVEKSLKKQSLNELKALSQDWMDAGLSYVFENPGIKGQLKRALMGLQQSQVSNISGSAFGVFDIVTNAVGIAEKVKKIRNKEQVSHTDKLYLATDTINVTQITARTVVLTTAQLAPIAAGTAAIMTLSAGSVFAAMMWAATAASVVELKEAIKKRDDPLHFLEDRLKRFDSEASCGHTDQAEVYKLHALALMRTNRDAYSDDQIEQALNRLKVSELGDPKPSDYIVVEALKQRQHDKVVNRSFNTAQWVIASVGMTLIALSPVCPYLLAPGLALAVTATAISIGQKLVNNIYNMIARDMVSKTMGIDKKPDMDIALEMCQRKNPELTMTGLREMLGDMSKYRRKIFLKGARTRYLQDKVLTEKFGEDFESKVPKKNRAEFANQYCREQFSMAKFVDIYFKKQDVDDGYSKAPSVR